MEPQFHVNDEVSALERALRELVPAPARLDVAQTMFRAGQAAASRSSPWRRVWPATTAVFALVSLALATLLALPKSPRIVYVPVGAATEDARVPPSAMLATDGAAGAGHALPASPTGEQAEMAEMARSDMYAPSSFGYLRSRALALNDCWDTAPAVSPHAPIPAPRSGDWRAMVGDQGALEPLRPFDSYLPLDWTRLLNIRGS